MSTFATIVTGVSVFVLGQIVLKAFIEPVQKLRETIAEVTFHLANADDVVHGVGTVKEERCETVTANLRQLGARLVSNQHLVPFYDYLSKTLSLPEKQQIKRAAERLSQIPAHMYGNDPVKHERLDLYRIEICELLGVHDPLNKGMSKKDLIDAIRKKRGWTWGSTPWNPRSFFQFKERNFMKTGTLYIYFISLLAFTAGIANAGNSLPLQKADEVGIKKCLTKIGIVSDHVIEGVPHGSDTIWHIENADEHLISFFVSRGHSHDDSQISMHFSPNKHGGCDAAYTETFVMEHKCTELVENTFQGMKYRGRLNKKTIALQNEAGSVDIYLTPTGKKANLCIVTKREVIY